jgi:hypothetical protein
VKRKETRSNLYYVLALVPQGKANEFFVLPQQDANDLIVKNSKRPRKHGSKPKWDGFLFDAALPFKERWDYLPK